MNRNSDTWRDACALVLFSLLVNLIGISHRSVGLDESSSVSYVRLPFSGLFTVLTGGDPNMGLYHLLLSGWVRLVGESELAIRSFSAGCGALAVGTIYLLASHLFGRRAGLIAGVLLALNAFIVEYAQTARAYGLLVLLVLLSSLLFVREIEHPSRSTRAGYVLASVLAFHAHYFAAFVVAAQFAVALVTRRETLERRRWVGTGLAIALLCVPEAFIAYRSGTISNISWINPPSVNDIPGVLLDFSGGSLMILVVLLAGMCLAGMASLRRREYWPFAFLLAWLFVPVTLVFAMSMATPMFLSYYLIGSVPALVLLGTAGIDRIGWRVVRGAILALTVFLCARQVVALYGRESVQDWRGATQYVLGSTQAGDGVLFFPNYARNPFDYYARQVGGQQPPILKAPPVDGVQRLWLVTRESDVPLNNTAFLELESALAERYRRSERREFGLVGVELYVR